jgi:hypothetical protein
MKFKLLTLHINICSFCAAFLKQVVIEMPHSGKNAFIRKPDHDVLSSVCRHPLPISNRFGVINDSSIRLLQSCVKRNNDCIQELDLRFILKLCLHFNPVSNHFFAIFNPLFKCETSHTEHSIVRQFLGHCSSVQCNTYFVAVVHLS